jgi:hypothetical protein
VGFRKAVARERFRRPALMRARALWISQRVPTEVADTGLVIRAALSTPMVLSP